MWAALALTVAALSAPAHAVTPVSQPSPTPISTAQSVCRGAPAAPGQSLRGPVLHIPSAGVLCVATGASPDTWVPVTLAAPALSRAVLMSAAFGQNATCSIAADGRGDCWVEGADLADKLARTKIQTALDWR